MDFSTLLTATVTIPIAGLMGGKIGVIIADTVEPIPSWLSPLLGPAGVLVGMVFTIRWLLSKLDKQEVKAEARDLERAANIATLTEIATQNQSIIEQNSNMLRDARFAIEKCVKCELKHKP